MIHQTNQGIATVRNAGIKLAKGDYLFWIDRDDYIKENIIERLYENLVAYDADISICDFIKGSEINYIFPEENNFTVECFSNQHGLELIYKNDHYSFIMAASWAKLIKKSYIMVYHILMVKYLKIYISHHLINICKKIVFTNEVMYYYYQWPESILGKQFSYGV